MSRDELDLDALAVEPVVPADRRRAALWAAGIAASAIAVLFLLLTTDLVLGRPTAPGALTAPDGFGEWRADPQSAAVVADQVRADQQSLGLTPFSAAYTDNRVGLIVAWGGTGPTGGRPDDDAMLRTLRERTQRMVPDVRAGAPAAADPGAHRGRASCAQAVDADRQYTICGWIFGRTALGLLIVDGTDAGTDPGARLREVLDHLVL
ncbi:hypothetical protein ACQP00_12715 [Dactylosporangium sp. CS-047395]|uniref:hypothetical protein n=1 Tax=Dactylosporangium sp. CS-047395 TaxID=3239936 RepID=UPI003D949A59